MIEFLKGLGFGIILTLIGYLIYINLKYAMNDYIEDKIRESKQ